MHPPGELETAAPESGHAEHEAAEGTEALRAEMAPPDSAVAEEQGHREIAEEAHAEEQDRHEEHREEPREPYRPEPPERAPRPPVPPRREFKPAAPAAVTEAIEEISRVITSLKQVLDTMEEILETLELAEVQKNADEREIQSLRNLVRDLDRRGPDARRDPSGDQPGRAPSDRGSRHRGRR